ncbi:MAG: metallopeptidase family protein [Actinobacteria bacterium]|nr:metallopeptidase family protein [Actinomycetota bacterium]
MRVDPLHRPVPAPARDRHGRGPRGPLAWPPVPAMGPRRQRFDDLVIEVAGGFDAVLGERYADTEFAVEDVPPSDPAPWEERRVLLGRLFPASGRLPARIVLYRRPIEARTSDGSERAELVREVLAEHIAALLGVAPEDLLPPT